MNEPILFELSKVKKNQMREGQKKNPPPFLEKLRQFKAEKEARLKADTYTSPFEVS